MGGNSPSHLEEGDAGGVTFVKGIRVSESSGTMHELEVGESASFSAGCSKTLAAECTSVFVVVVFSICIRGGSIIL